MTHEPREASVAVIGVSAGVIALLIAFSIGASTCVYHATSRGAAARPSIARQTSFTDSANVRPGIVQDYEAVNRSAAEHLERYAWVDRQAGVARIPIERAMQLLATGVKPRPAPSEPGQVP